MRENPARDVVVELVPLLRLLEKAVVVDGPFIGRRAHRHGADRPDERSHRPSPCSSVWASNSQSSELFSSAMNPSMLAAVKYCVAPTRYPLTAGDGTGDVP